jgi:hypothetical protein
MLVAAEEPPMNATPPVEIGAPEEEALDERR